MRLPLPLRLMRAFPVLRRIPARLIGVGVRPEHVQNAGASAALAMSAYVALLRAINVGGRNAVSMAELKRLAAAIGLERGRLESLRAAIKGPERVDIVANTAYLFYPDGMGRSKLTITMIEKKLGARGSARNWNTVLKLLALANA